MAGKWTVSRRGVSGTSTVTFITPDQGGTSHTPGPRQWIIEMAQIAVVPSLEGPWRPSVLNHLEIQAHVSKDNFGTALDQDTDAAEDIVNTAQPGIDIALMGEEIGQPSNER